MFVPSLALAATLVAVGDARAHRLEADYRVLPGRRVQIESWFDLTGESPKGAAVRIYRPAGQLLTEGQLDEKGIFVFSYMQAERLKVVVSAGAGHRKELEIPESELAGETTDSQSRANRGVSTDQLDTNPVPLADRSTRLSLKDVIMGVGFLLALAAFALSVRNARKLEELKRAKTAHEGDQQPFGGSD
jgi:nickel transport protein